MRYAILGDVHANYEALAATLTRCSELSVDHYFCVGDIVGYGADPALCLRTLQKLGCECVAGNHDRAVTGRLQVDYFNQFARQAVEWTRSRLSADELKFLDELPLIIRCEDLSITHASFHNPEAFEYIQTSYDAFHSFQHFDSKVGFIGHSHVPVAFLGDRRQIFISTETEIRTNEHEQCLINVGSVGQPRDNDPRAAFGLYDTDGWQFELHRVDYDVETASNKILAAGLPELLAERLKVGR